jgi:type IV pilus assembly protein PilA
MAKRLLSDERGFSFIEVMVVVLIIAVLVAVAIPSRLGARTRSQDRAAQAAARNALTTASAIFSDDEDFSRADQATLRSEAPSITFVGSSASSDAQEISTTTECVGSCGDPARHNRFVAAVRSESGTCWFAQSVAGPDVPNGGVTWEQAEDVDCEAADAPAFDSTNGDDAWARSPGRALP